MIKNRTLRYISIIIAFTLFASWVLFLPIRSVIYVIRIYKEFTYPVEGYFEEIKACEKGLELDSSEKIRYFNYLNLGEKCEE